MNCNDVNECFKQIKAYFQAERLGQILLVNTENDDVYREIVHRLEIDNSKKKIYVSHYLQANGLPDVDLALDKISGNGNYVLIGLSQALMLRSMNILEAEIDKLLERPTSGYAIVVLEHCQQALQNIMHKTNDTRWDNRIIFTAGEASALPQIKLLNNEAEADVYNPFKKLADMLSALERMQIKGKEIVCLTPFSVAAFKNAIYPISTAPDIFMVLSNKYLDLASAAEKDYGTDKQWSWLAKKLAKYSNFSELVCSNFCTTANLSVHLANMWEQDNEELRWLHWLAMKVFDDKSNKYLSLVLQQCTSFETFREHLYLDLSYVSLADADFSRFYVERKRLLATVPEDLTLIQKYCDILGRYQKNLVFYLTDNSDIEKQEFLRCLSIYDYTPEELAQAINQISKPLSLYMQPFVFDDVNTKLSDSDAGFRTELTDYFTHYKMQKLTNCLQSAFLNKVNEYALDRPYNKLPPRSSIISHMDRKHTQLFFFDALGVEYLSYILAKCEEYDLVYEVVIGHCELPSITSKNKEFLQYYADNEWNKIDALDEMKHHSQIYNYEKCQYPLHLFAELAVIDEELRRIQAQLIQDTIDKAVIVSDHGASRLAVLYGKEN